MTISDARKNLFKLVDNVSDFHEPTLIKGKRNSAVLISNEDWENIQETLFVMQNEELAASLISNSKEPLSKCSTKLEW